MALVGETGAGKSTVASLLLRFIRADAGVVAVDGTPLDAMDTAAWRRAVAWVPQAPHLFTGTVADNIRLGRPDATAEQVEAAARQAGAESFIRALPHGYDTALGEEGLRLSGGERQRLAIARAFLRDAPFVILDEATAHLDAATEAGIVDAVRRLARDRTVLVISHRLRLAAVADEIVVLDAGRAVEAGAPGDLRARGGAYARLVAADAGVAIGPGRRGPRLRLRTRGPRHRRARGAGPVSVFRREVALLAGHRRWIALGALLGCAAIGSSIGLMAVSAFLIAKSALITNVAEVSLAVTAVRVLAISRAVSRYFERYATHRATLRILTGLRVWFYRAIEPLAPARLSAHHSGDLLARIVSDIDTLEDFYVRVLVPPVVAVLITLFASLVLGAFDPATRPRPPRVPRADRRAPPPREPAAQPGGGRGCDRRPRRASARSWSTRCAAWRTSSSSARTVATATASSLPVASSTAPASAWRPCAG